MPDVQRVSEAFSRLFRTYPGFQTDDLEGLLGVYFEAIEAYDTQDIEAAVASFLHGTAVGHNPAFAPSAPLVASEVRRQMNERLDAERRRNPVRSLPPPEVVHSPESRARVRAMVERFVEDHRTEKATADGSILHSTNQMFQPDMSPAAIGRRLGFSVGDPDGDAA